MGDEQSIDRVPPEVLAVHRDVALRTNELLREDELLQLFADALRLLLPGALVCVRLIDAPARALSCVYATGRLRPEMRERLLATGAAGEAGPPAEVLGAAGIARVDAYEPVFEGARGGVDVVLHAADQILGLLNVEWETGGPPGETGRTVLVSAAHQLATALHGARMRAEIVHLRDYMAKLVDHADAPILVVDAQRRVKMFNRSLERITGRTRDAVLGRDVLDLVPAEEQPRFLAALGGALRGTPAAHCELRLPRANAPGPAHLVFNLAPVLGVGGEAVEEIVAVGQDLTEMHRLQRQMIHTEKLATSGQLAAGVVHEINNPLTSISIHADYLAKVLERQGRSPQELTFVNRIRDAANRILRFTQDLMAFARPGGKEPELLELPAVIDQAAAFCEHVIARAGVRVERRYGPAPKVYGIRGQFQQVFINLITNACHAMVGVQGDRILTLLVADNGDGRVRAEVGDTGPGIPEEIRDQIFEPFFTTKREGEGTGLGLSIVRNIVDNHQAEIRVEGEGGKGTRFVVVFYAA
jgi:PAS domain S-box-containing protein